MTIEDLEELDTPETHDQFVRATAVAYAQALDAGQWDQARHIASRYFRLGESDIEDTIEKRRACQ